MRRCEAFSEAEGHSGKEKEKEGICGLERVCFVMHAPQKCSLIRRAVAVNFTNNFAEPERILRFGNSHIVDAAGPSKQ